MAKGEEHSDSANEQPIKESGNGSSYESNVVQVVSKIVLQVVSKIGDEPLLFVIGVISLLVVLAALTTQIGSSDLRIIIITIASLSFLVIIGYYVRGRFHPKNGTKKQKPIIPPVFRESEKFSGLSTFEEKKDLIYSRANLDISEEEKRRCEGSPWDFDRIVLYLHEEKSNQPKFEKRLEHVNQEWEKLRASEGRRSLIPLHYATRSMLKFLERKKEPPKEAKPSLPFFRTTLEYLKARPEIDQGGEVKSNLAKVIRILGKRGG